MFRHIYTGCIFSDVYCCHNKTFNIYIFKETEDKILQTKKGYKEC